MHEDDRPRPVVLSGARGEVRLGDGPVKTIVPLTAASPAELLDGARAACAEGCDILEWRVDHLDGGNRLPSALDAARQLSAVAGAPILATFRTPAEGGNLPIETGDYETLLTGLAASELVQAIDVEYSRGAALARRVIRAAHASGVATIASHHDFAATAPRGQILARLRDMAGLGAGVAKIACTPRSNDDVLALLAASSQASRQLGVPIIAISMGELGVVSRVAAGQFGSCATFASVGPASAPGQVPLADVRPVLDALASWAGLTSQS